MYKVITVWVDQNNTQVGALILADNGVESNVLLSELLRNYRGLLDNAVVTNRGLRGKKGVHLLHKKVSRSTDNKSPTYTLMHRDDKVCDVYKDKVSIINADKLPFELRKELLKVTDLEGEMYKSVLFNRWLDIRVSHLSREYMNRVYMLRHIGRDRERILVDSCGVSVRDNFWILRSDLKTDWSELRRTLDTNLSIVNTALTGEIDFDKEVKGTTSIFTIQGYFPKALYRGFILKKGYTAEYEVLGCEIGNFLGVSVAQAKVRGDGIVMCKLFTDKNISLVHAKELLRYLGFIESVFIGSDNFTEDDKVHQWVYNYFKKIKRLDIVKGLERLFILNYVLGNKDLHGENFGLLYSNDTFEILTVAPSYDFNNAFMVSEPTMYYKWITDNLVSFIRNNEDIRDKLLSNDFIVMCKNLRYINENEKKSLINRVEWLKNQLDF